MDETSNRHSSLAGLAFGLSLAGFLPVPGVVASIAAVACGRIALRGTIPDPERAQARIATVLGAIGILLPVLLLFVYCVVLGYPFPIHRYRPAH